MTQPKIKSRSIVLKSDTLTVIHNILDKGAKIINTKKKDFSKSVLLKCLLYFFIITRF